MARNALTLRPRSFVRHEGASLTLLRSRGSCRTVPPLGTWPEIPRSVSYRRVRGGGAREAEEPGFAIISGAHAQSIKRTGFTARTWHTVLL